MKNIILLSAMALAGALSATDVNNQDSKSYTIKVQGEGNLSISEHKIGSGGSLYGLCGYSFCTFRNSGRQDPGDARRASEDQQRQVFEVR
jgi:hypothetical protein